MASEGSYDYVKTVWENGITPINDSNLNKVEDQLGLVSDGVATIGDLDDLETTSKENLVEAINELNQKIEDCGFEDSTITTTGSLIANWKVRKWNNGFCEMWGNSTWTINFSTAYGNSKYAEVNSVPLPITLTRLYGVQINTFQTGQIFFTTVKYYGTDRFSFFIGKPEMSNGNLSVGFEFYARGTWK